MGMISRGVQNNTATSLNGCFPLGAHTLSPLRPQQANKPFFSLPYLLIGHLFSFPFFIPQVLRPSSQVHSFKHPQSTSDHRFTHLAGTLYEDLTGVRVELDLIETR